MTPAPPVYPASSLGPEPGLAGLRAPGPEGSLRTESSLESLASPECCSLTEAASAQDSPAACPRTAGRSRGQKLPELPGRLRGSAWHAVSSSSFGGHPWGLRPSFTNHDMCETKQGFYGLGLDSRAQPMHSPPAFRGLYTEYAFLGGNGDTAFEGESAFLGKGESGGTAVPAAWRCPAAWRSALGPLRAPREEATEPRSPWGQLGRDGTRL